MQQAGPIEFLNSKLFYFKEKTDPVNKGDRWVIKGSSEGEVVMINGDSTVEVTIRKEVVVITYGDQRGYYFRLENDFYGLYLTNQNQNMHRLELKLRENNVDVGQWQDVRQELKVQIINTCGEKIYLQPYIEMDTVDLVGFTVGQIVGTLDNMVKSIPTEGIRSSYNAGVDTFKEKYISVENRGKWASFKGKLKDINKSITETIQPVSNKVVGVKNSVGEKLQNSDNSVIKGVRTFSKKIENSLNNGVFKVMEVKGDKKDEKDEKEVKVDIQMVQKPVGGVTGEGVDKSDFVLQQGTEVAIKQSE